MLMSIKSALSGLPINPTLSGIQLQRNPKRGIQKVIRKR